MEAAGPEVRGETKEEAAVPECELKEGLEKLISMAKEKMSLQKRTVVEIAGGSASGKTSAVAAKLKEALGEEALIFSMDDYYRGKTFMEAEARKGNVLNWDQPEALDLDLLKEHLRELKSGRPVQKPVYDFKAGEPQGSETVEPKKAIIVEGLFALNDLLAKEGDVRAFVDIGTHGRILRRLLRDIERTRQKPADILRYFAEVVEPMQEKYVDVTKENADLVIHNEYSPKVEAEKSGLHEIQLKFKAGDLDPETIRRSGAERLGSFEQTDTYYNPKDRNLIATDEMLRIREEGDLRILTYKGPKLESQFRERPKFEFEIDAETEKSFLAVYGDKVKMIKKQRTLYALGGAVFSVDSVLKIENGETADLGEFLEIRATDKDFSAEKMDRLLAGLGLKMESGIKESYFEM